MDPFEAKKPLATCAHVPIAVRPAVTQGLRWKVLSVKGAGPGLLSGVWQPEQDSVRQVACERRGHK